MYTALFPMHGPSRVTRVLGPLLCLLVALSLYPAAAQSPHTHRHGFGDAEKWAQVFDDPERDAWQKPHEVIQALALKPDATVVDIGAGTGYFAARLARMLPNGTVYAVDVEPEMVKYLAERAKREGLDNLKPVAATPSELRIPQQADLILLVDVYHHVEDRNRYFRRLAASLTQGGRLAVIDFKLDSPHGPPRRARVAPGKVKAELTGAGYALQAEHGFLPHQYFLVFQPQAR
jgi:SAM-dependent methyltransferase